MSRSQYRLLLMMALASSGGAYALGLGDLHVDSELNQPLSAYIDIVGATDEELSSLSAAIANRETFQRFGSDRPSFLSSTTFKVARNEQGRPILAIRSTEAFTEPLVNFLVDMRWSNGEVVREYSLLLDPAHLTGEPTLTGAPTLTSEPTLAGEPAYAAPKIQVPDQTRMARPNRQSSRYSVVAKRPLLSIARSAGARSKSDLHRMMIAIFRANPQAFDGNINRLHRYALLIIPTRAEIAVISKTEANNEFHSQMAAWHSIRKAPESSATEGLRLRVKSLQQSLDEVHDLMARQHVKLLGLQQRVAANAPVATVPVAAVPVAAVPVAAVPVAAVPAMLEASVGPPSSLGKPGNSRFVLIAAGFGLLIGFFALLRVWYRGGTVPIEVPDVVQPPADPQAADPQAANPQAVNPLPVNIELPKAATTSRALPIVATAGASTFREHSSSGDTTVTLVGDTTVSFVLNSTLSLPPDYNVIDLDATVQHVHMPSVLHDNVVVAERRTNIVDVLRLAIEQEPHRSELRMKLLELYYTAAANNRQAFLDVVQKLTQERELLSTEDWDKIVRMGRQIALDDPVFSLDPKAGDVVADCA